MEIRDAVRTEIGEIGAMIHELAAFERMAHEVTWSPDQLERHLFADVPAAPVDGWIRFRWLSTS